jgi:hypothetical protein
MGNSSSSDINTFLDSTQVSPVLKKPIRISETMTVVPITEPIIKKLHIDEEIWFEEIPTSEGILLKISSRMIGSNRDASTSKEAKEVST